MEINELDALNLKKEDKKNEVEKDLSVLNLKKQERPEKYSKLEGTGVESLRLLSTIVIILGLVLCIIGIVQILDSSHYHSERLYIGIFCISAALSCFIYSPIFKVLATIGEAAKIYRDKNCQIESNDKSHQEAKTT